MPPRDPNCSAVAAAAVDGPVMTKLVKSNLSLHILGLALQILALHAPAATVEVNSK
jgi:hypothetical protein